jgi:1-deoxy-D-xylulose-5-phosphate reductoisomerase
VTILGSTGSVGCNTVDLVERVPDLFRVEALTGGRNAELLAAQARRVGARLAVVADHRFYKALKESLSGSGIEVAAGESALVEAAQRPSDLVMAAILGAAGLKATLAAAERGVTVALANKETLVCAGHLMLDVARRNGAEVLPVDSEHSAIFQVLDRGNLDSVESITLTASGGPFRTFPTEALSNVTPKQALAHPNWDMGAKISIDSATMMNKGLELIEAHHLFGLPQERIGILVHPQSVIHSMVSYIDGSVLAQLGSPDMRTPIAYALAWPRRMPAPVERLDLQKVAQLTFESPDPARFPALRLAREALCAGGQMPTVLNAANEVAVAAFLKGKIGFLGISDVVEAALEKQVPQIPGSIEEIFEIDCEARALATSLAENYRLNT